MSRDSSREEYTFEDRGIDIPEEDPGQQSMLSPTGSTDTGHGGSPTSMAHTVTETDAFSDSDTVHLHEIVTQMTAERDHFSKKVEQLRARVEQYESTIEAYERKDEEKDDTIEKQRKMIEDLQNKNENLQRKNEDLHRTNIYIEEHRDEISDDASCDTSIDEASSSQRPSYRRRTRAEHDVVGLLNETEELGTELRRLQIENSRLRDLCSELQESSRKSRENEQMCDAQKREIDRLTRLHDDHAKQIEYLNSELMFRDNKIRGAAHLEAKAKRLEQELSTLKSATPQVGSEEVKRREDQLKRRTKEVDDLTKRIEALRDQYEGEKNKNKSLQEELDHLQNDHRSLQANSTKERDVLLQRLHDTEEQLKGFESVREAVTNMNLYSEAERTRQSTSVLPSAVYPDLSYSELNASTSSITSSATDSEDHVIGLWKLLPEEIRRKFAEFAISDTGRTTSVAKCIKRLKKLTLKLDIERQTFQVRAPRSGDSTLSLTQSIESVHSKEKKVLRNAATDCSGLYVPIFDHSMTPRNSQDSLFLENVAGPPRVPSRERILLEEIGATGKYTHTVADEVNNAISKSVEIRPVSVSIQAEEGQTVEKLLEENLVQKRTIDNLRADLGMKNADIDDLNKQLDELNGLIDELEEENKRDKERNQSFELENERLVREKEEFRSECEKLAEKVCRLEEDAQLYQRQIEEDDAKAKDVENRLDELENAALTRKPLEEELRKLALRNSELEFEVKKVTKEYEKLKERHSKVKKDMNESFDRMERFQEEQIKKIKVLQMGNYEREKFIKTIRKRILRLCKFVKKHHPSDETLLTELDAISSGCSRQDKGLIGSES